MTELALRLRVFWHRVVLRRKWLLPEEIDRLTDDEFEAWIEDIGSAAQIREALQEARESRR